MAVTEIEDKLISMWANNMPSSIPMRNVEGKQVPDLNNQATKQQMIQRIRQYTNAQGWDIQERFYNGTYQIQMVDDLGNIVSGPYVTAEPKAGNSIAQLVVDILRAESTPAGEQLPWESQPSFDDDELPPPSPWESVST